MAKCFECGSDAEYVGLNKVEGCSNPQCRFHGPSGVPVIVAIDPASDGGAVASKDEPLVRFRLSKKRVPVPALESKGVFSFQDCGCCWANDGKNGCRKYSRPVTDQQVCANFEWPPQINELPPAVGAIADIYAGFFEKAKQQALDALRLPEHMVRLDVVKARKRPTGAAEAIRFELAKKFEHMRLSTKATVLVRIEARDPEEWTEDDRFTIKCGATVWVNPSIVFKTQGDLVFGKDDQINVTLLATRGGSRHNIPEGEIFGFSDPMLRKRFDILQLQPGTGGCDDR